VRRDLQPAHRPRQLVEHMFVSIRRACDKNTALTRKPQPAQQLRRSPSLRVAMASARGRGGDVGPGRQEPGLPALRRCRRRPTPTGVTPRSRESRRGTTGPPRTPRRFASVGREDRGRGARRLLGGARSQGR
jgi:hypothetical protein